LIFEIIPLNEDSIYKQSNPFEVYLHLSAKVAATFKDLPRELPWFIGTYCLHIKANISSQAAL